MNEKPCFFCGEQSKYEMDPNFDAYNYNCPKCGKYTLDDNVIEELKERKDDIFRLACLIRENRLNNKRGRFGLLPSGLEPGANSSSPRCAWWRRVDDLLKEFPKATEIIDRALLNLGRLVKNYPMEAIQIQNKDRALYTFCPESVFKGPLNYLITSGLVADLGSSIGEDFITITPDGWNRIQELSKTGRESKQAFVAMWFDHSMDPFYEEAIKPAVTDAGYECKRVDMVEHNNKICDEIVAEIRKSRFIIADFTGQRGGVYFEAGFAMGLGLPVIWLVHKDDVEKLHFDTRQYAHIAYETADELRKSLYNRIAATIY